MTMQVPITSSQNDRQGSGKYRPLERAQKPQEETSLLTLDEDLKKALDDLDKASIRTTFKQASDPIYLAFKHIDSKPLPTLAKEFVKDNASDFIEFISKIFA